MNAPSSQCMLNYNKWSSPPTDGDSSTNNTDSLVNLSDRDSDRDPRVIVNGKDIKERSAVKIRMLGAGPVATWTAVHTKARNPDADIEMYEKRTEYARNHTINIDDSCFKSMDTFNHPVINPCLKQLRDKIRSNNGKIGCKEFETELKSIALAAGIKVHAGDEFEAIAISGDKLWLKGGPGGPVGIDYDVLVCADGAHSKARKAMAKMADTPDGEEATINFSHLPREDDNSEFARNEKMQYRVRVKYKVEGEARRLSRTWRDFFRYAYASFKLMFSPVSEQISAADSNNQREVTVDFFISEEEYNSLAGYNLKTAANLETAGVAPSLIKKIKQWQEIKSHCRGEVQIAGSEEITPYYLSFFHARKVQLVTASKKLILLAGDAKTALPYWRSLNNGLVTEAELAKHLASATHENLPEVGKAHESYANKRAWMEIGKAKVKNFCVNAANLYLKVSSAVPWQINVWSSSRIRQMQLAQRSVSVVG